jgi:hypothetical protein
MKRLTDDERAVLEELGRDFEAAIRKARAAMHAVERDGTRPPPMPPRGSQEPERNVECPGDPEDVVR